MKRYSQTLSVHARSDVQNISLEITWTILLILLFKKSDNIRETTNKNRLPWPGSRAITLMSHLTTGGPGEERGTNKLSPTGTRKKRPKGERGCQAVRTSSLPESFSLEFILAEWHAVPGPWVRVIGQTQQGTNPITEAVGYMAEQFPYVLFHCCPLPGLPFPTKSLALSVHASLQTIHFQVLEKSPFSSSRSYPPSCNNNTDLFFLR